jgi:hypothetical protein
MAYDANVAALQSAANRFASTAGFPLLKADGVWGAKTSDATYRTLGWITKANCINTGCVDDQDAETSINLMAQWANTAGAASGLAHFINGVADEIGLAYVAAPTSSSPGVPSQSGNPVLPPWIPTRSIWDTIKLAPVWQKVLAGVLAGIGLIWLSGRIRGTGKSLSGFGESWLRDDRTGELIRPATTHEISWYRHKGRIDLPYPVQRGGGMRRYSVIDV